MEKVLESFGERLQSVMDKHDLTQVQLADIVGVSQNTISKWVRKEEISRTTKKKLYSFSEKYNVDIEWLATGSKSPFKMDFDLPEEIETPIIARARSDRDGATSLTMGELKRILGGNHEVIAFRVEGQSMAPTLNDRDLLLCRAGDFRENHVHILHYVDELGNEKHLCKRLKKEERPYYVVMSDNPNWGTFQVPEANVLHIYRAVSKVTRNLSGFQNGSQELNDRITKLEDIIRKLNK